jgi:serine phosphatase RsbU (regulator of sigma subunit)
MSYQLSKAIYLKLRSIIGNNDDVDPDSHTATAFYQKWLIPVLFLLALNVPLLFEVSTFAEFYLLHVHRTSLLCTDILVLLLLGRNVYQQLNLKFRSQLKSNTMFQAIVHRMPVKIAVYNAQHRYIYLNPASEPCKKMREQIFGKDDFEYLALQGKDLNLALERRKRFLNAVETKEKVEWIDSSDSNTGNPSHTLRRYKPLYSDNGKLEMVIGVDSDITDLVGMKEKDKEFKANLRYAKNIQNAILPNLNKAWALGELFVYHKPKDVVSGDFYWYRHKNDSHYFAVADCTGHGVSGALLTIICHQALNRCFDEFELKSPAGILNKCRELILFMLKNGGNTIADGMDIAICAIHKNTLVFSGANRPLWLLRDGAIQEFNGDRYPIGRYTSNMEKFNETQIELVENDIIYLFSDGITDQFGGDHNKKFSKQRLRPLLTKIGDLPLVQQRTQLIVAIESWMEKHEQLDDICFLGITYGNATGS